MALRSGSVLRSLIMIITPEAVREAYDSVKWKSIIIEVGYACISCYQWSFWWGVRVEGI